MAPRECAIRDVESGSTNTQPSLTNIWFRLWRLKWFSASNTRCCSTQNNAAMPNVSPKLRH